MNAQATPIKKSAKSTAPIPATTNPDAPVSPSLPAPALPNINLLNEASDMLGQTHKMMLCLTQLLCAARLGESVSCEQLATLLRPIECNLYTADDLLTQALDEIEDMLPATAPARRPIALV